MARKIVDLVSYMESELPSNYVHCYRDVCRQYVYGVQTKIAEMGGGEPLLTRDERILAALETFEGPFNEKTSLPRTREFRVHSGVVDVKRKDLRRLAG